MCFRRPDGFRHAEGSRLVALLQPRKLHELEDLHVPLRFRPPRHATELLHALRRLEGRNHDSADLQELIQVLAPSARTRSDVDSVVPKDTIE